MKRNVGLRKAGFVDVIVTITMCICLLSISWLINVWMEDPWAADDSLREFVGTRSLVLFSIAILVFVFFQWRRHKSLWIGAIQGAVLSVSIMLPMMLSAMKTPSIPPTSARDLPIFLLFSLFFGAVLATIEIGICWFILRRTLASKATVDVSNSQVQIVGIRGWLIFPAIGIIVGFIQNTINIINHASFIESHTADEALHLIPSLIIQMVLLVWLVVIAAQFFKKKRVLPYNIVRFLIGRSVAYLLLFILGNEVYSFIAIVIAAIFWIPYFKFSKRVKATFVN